MKSRCFFISIFLILTVSCSSQSAQKRMLEEDLAAPLELNQVPEELVKYKVVFYNSSGETLTFQLGESTSDMKKVKIKPYGNEISDSFTQSPIFIIYTSNEIFSRYTLELGESYKIYFNKDQKKWDLIHLIKYDP